MSMPGTPTSDAAQAEATDSVHPVAGKCPIPWWKRLTLLTFLFFLIKGLAWLVVPAVIIWWRSVAV
jgi:hypothetical protein